MKNNIQGHPSYLEGPRKTLLHMGYGYLAFISKAKKTLRIWKQHITSSHV